MRLTALLFAVELDRLGHRAEPAGLLDLALPRRHRGGRGERDRAGLHRRGRARAHPGAPRLAAAAGDRARHLPGARRQRPDRAHGGLAGCAVLVRRAGVALDVLGGGAFLRSSTASGRSSSRSRRGTWSSTGRAAEAAAVLTRIGEPGRGGADQGHPGRRWARTGRRGSADLRAPKGLFLPIVWAGIGLSVFQQFVGINVIFYYSTALWHSVGFTEQDSMRISSITGVINIVTTLIAIAFVDRFGRKPLLLDRLGRHDADPRDDGVALRERAARPDRLAGALGRRTGRPPSWPPTSTSSPSASRGDRSCGSCSARCSTTGSAARRWRWRRRRSGSPTGS